MQSSIRIIKRGAGGNTNGLSADEIEKTVQQRGREMANTVKSWVAEWEARNRALKRPRPRSFVEDSRPAPAPQFGFHQ